jgi:hypothetical protein
MARDREYIGDAQSYFELEAGNISKGTLLISSLREYMVKAI